MKPLLLLLAISTVALTGCSSNYYLYECVEPSKVYVSPSNDAMSFAKIERSDRVLVKKRKKRNAFWAVKFRDHSGYVRSSHLSYVSRIKERNYLTSFSTHPVRPSVYDAPASSTSGSGGSVQVKGYYRKDGTYVKPHTRSAPTKRH